MAKGKTLWEMLTDKLLGPVESKVYNPLRAKVGNAMMIDTIEWRDFNFFVRQIAEYRRRIGGKDFLFVDYVLLARPLNADDVLVELRLNPVDDPENYGGMTHHALLLRLDDEFAYSEDFHKVLTDDTGKFQVLEDGIVTEEFFRLNDVQQAYKAQVTVIADFNKDKRLDRGEVRKHRLEYWDYVREVKDEAGQPKREYLFIEMATRDGWFQIWRGSEIDAQKVLVM